MAQTGEIPVYGKLIAETTEGKICNAEQVAGLMELVSSVVQPEEKEVINVLTYAAEPPESPENGDLFINSATNRLMEYVYDEQEQEGTWDADEPSTAAIYITNDTQHIYIWNGEEFVDRTGEIVDNTIYVKNLTTDLAEVTNQGIYTVAYKSSSHVNWYTLIVSIARRGSRLAPIVTTSQTLTWQGGWSQRSKTGIGNWSDWTTHEYVYQDGYNKLRKVAAAGIVL